MKQVLISLGDSQVSSALHWKSESLPSGRMACTRTFKCRTFPWHSSATSMGGFVRKVLTQYSLGNHSSLMLSLNGYVFDPAM